MSKNKDELNIYLSLLTKIGVGMITCLLTGFLSGLYFDKIFHTHGILTIIGLLVGLGLGATFIYIVISKTMTPKE